MSWITSEEYASMRSNWLCQIASDVSSKRQIENFAITFNIMGSTDSLDESSFCELMGLKPNLSRFKNE